MSLTIYENPAFLNSIRTHFVAIGGNYAHLDEAGNPILPYQHFAFSAFVIEIRGTWCLMTAGHVLQKIDAVLKHPKMILHRCGLADYFSIDAKIKEPTPFSYEAENRIHVDLNGCDMGMIPLRDFYRTSLEANGIKPLPTAPWAGYNIPKFDDFAVFGLPEEDIHPIDVTTHRGSGLSVCLVLVPLDAEASPDIDPESNIPRFAAKLRDNGELKSVFGMSGGPIIGIHQNERGWSYACVAIQGSWNSISRTVYGTPVGIIVSTMEDILDRSRQNV